MPIETRNTLNTVQKIIDYIEDHILDSLTPSQIAKQFYLSVSVLSNLFKIVCDMTIMEYIRNRRLSLAGKELVISSIHIIDLAFKYGYETPEAFTKAFTRFHGFPPSFVRRTYPQIRSFNPLLINIEIHGGWEDASDINGLTLTKQNYSKQDNNLLCCYDETTKNKGGIPMDRARYKYHISLKNMQQKEDWRLLLSLAKRLNNSRINFKVDGKTMIFAHGLEFKLEKICLTFKWNEEQRVKDHFNYNGTVKSSFNGFKYFDTIFEGMKVRCMFYGNCQGDDTDEFLYRNTEPVDVDGYIIYVQTLEFYYENAEPNSEHYKMVEQWLNRNN